jgi:replicative DNA helicase
MSTEPIDPNSPEVWLVAGALIKPALAAEAAPLVKGEDFSDPRLGRTWDAIVELLNEGAKEENIDIMSVAKRFTPKPHTQKKVALFLSDVIEHFPRRTSLTNVAQRIRRRSILMTTWDELKTLGGVIHDQLQSTDGEVKDLDERLAQLSIKVAMKSDSITNRTVFRDRAVQVGKYFDELSTGPAEGTVPTGIFRLDKKLGGGLRPGQLHSILGGTGSGKTALASQICDEAVKRGHGSILFSMEVDPLDVYIRDVERRSGKSRWKLRAFSEADRREAQHALVKAQAAILNESEGKVVYGEPMSVEGIRQTILTEQLRTGKIEVVAVDHAQVALPNASEKANRPRYLEVKSTAEGLRQIARRMNIVVVLTAQLNPAQKGEKNDMSRVREGKDINNCSEVVMVINHLKEDVGEDTVISDSWIAIEKCRAGTEGKVPVRYRGEIYRFEDQGAEDE